MIDPLLMAMVPWRYLSHIEKLGYDLNDLILHNVNRTFFFWRPQVQG